MSNVLVPRYSILILYRHNILYIYTTLQLLYRETLLWWLSYLLLIEKLKFPNFGLKWQKFECKLEGMRCKKSKLGTAPKCVPFATFSPPPPSGVYRKPSGCQKYREKLAKSLRGGGKGAHHHMQPILLTFDNSPLPLFPLNCTSAKSRDPLQPWNDHTMCRW